MKRAGWLLGLLVITVSAWGQAAKTQTPREALIEMIASPTPGTFQDHLLNETREKLVKLGQSAQQQFALPLMMMNAQTHSNSDAKWNATGPVLVSFDTPKSGGSMEIHVDRDVIKGDRDEMDLSFHAIKDGHEDPMNVAPHLMVIMKSEENVWKLSEVGFSISVKLNGALVDSIQKQMDQAATQMKVSSSIAPSDPFSPSVASEMHPSTVEFRPPNASEKSALSGLKNMIAAENAFKVSNPQVGYTCTLSDLGTAVPAHAQVADVEWGPESQGVYRYSVYGCRGSVSSTFKLVAAPVNVRQGLRAFCADESGVLRFAEDGRGSTCLSEHNLVK